MGSASSEDICSNKKTEEVSAFLIISEQASIDTNRLMRFRVKVLSWATCQKIVCTSTQLPLSSQVCRFHRHADLTFLLRNCFFFFQIGTCGFITCGPSAVYDAVRKQLVVQYRTSLGGHSDNHCHNSSWCDSLQIVRKMTHTDEHRKGERSRARKTRANTYKHERVHTCTHAHKHERKHTRMLLAVLPDHPGSKDSR